MTENEIVTKTLAEAGTAAEQGDLTDDATVLAFDSSRPAGNRELRVSLAQIQSFVTGTAVGQAVPVVDVAGNPALPTLDASNLTNLPNAPVVSVNGQADEVTLTAANVGADPTGTAASAVAAHAIRIDVHLMSSIQGLTSALDGKASAAAFAAHLTDPDVHSVSAINGLQTTLDGMALTADLTNHVSVEGLAGHIPSGGIVDAHVASTAAIAWSKLDKSGAVASDVGAEPADPSLAKTNQVHTWTGAQTFNGAVSVPHPTLGGHAATRDFVIQSLAGLDSQQSVKRFTETPPASPAVGDRYLVKAVATGVWTGLEDSIVQWDGSAWIQTIPNTGFYVNVEDKGHWYQYNSSGEWTDIGAVIAHDALLNLQGGTTTERYHLSEPEHTLAAAMAVLGDGLIEKAGATANAVTITTFAKNIIAAATASAVRAVLELGTAATANTGTGVGHILQLSDRGDGEPGIPPNIGGMPVGSLIYWSAATPPSGWIFCNGAALSRTVYALLFAVIGVSWGAGDGVTTFNVPNLLGQFLRVWNPTGGGADAGRAFGSFQAQQLQGHSHDRDGILGNSGQGLAPSSGNYRCGQTTFGSIGGPISDGVNGVVNVGDKTYPDNIALPLILFAGVYVV